VGVGSRALAVAGGVARHVVGGAILGAADEALVLGLGEEPQARVREAHHRCRPQRGAERLDASLELQIDPRTLCLERRAAPCHNACPANIDIPTFMAHLGNGDYRSTIEVIRRDNPLPLVCGLVCPAPCESACVRGSHDGAVFIRPLKAKAAEPCLAEGGNPKSEIAPDTGKPGGIIGSGPSGAPAPSQLRTPGHEVECRGSTRKTWPRCSGSTRRRTSPSA